MTISKKQRFGLITFIILIILAIVVTNEPWKKLTKSAETSVGGNLKQDIPEHP